MAGLDMRWRHDRRCHRTFDIFILMFSPKGHVEATEIGWFEGFVG
jgi:hypothetical protein